MADTLVLGASAHACEFESRRLHQEKEMAKRPSPFLALVVDGISRRA